MIQGPLSHGLQNSVIDRVARGEDFMVIIRNTIRNGSRRITIEDSASCYA